MDSRTWQQPQPRGSVYAEKTTWLLAAAFALLLAGLMVNQSTTAFFTDTRVVSGNNFITASVALNETPFTAFNFEKFVPGDVFIRPVQVTNATASNSGAINVNYYMTVKDNSTDCSVADPTCPAGKGTLSDPTNGLRLVAIRCFSDMAGTLTTTCESNNLQSVRLVKGVMETIWPGGASGPAADNAGIVRDRNDTVQFGNVGGTGSDFDGSTYTKFPGLPNGGKPDDFFGRPIVFANKAPLSAQPISVKINPRRSDTANTAVRGSLSGTGTSNPVTQGSDVLRIGGTIQDLDGNWSKAATFTGGKAVAVGTLTGSVPSSECGKVEASTTKFTAAGISGCGAEVVGVPIQTLSNANCNGFATAVENRSVPNATGNQGNLAGPGANATVVSVSAAAANRQILSSQSHGACFMGGPNFERNSPIVLSPRINNQLMASGSGETPRIVSDIPAQSLFDSANTIAGLQAGATDNLALIVYLPSWSTQSTQDETGGTSLSVQSRTAIDAQGKQVQIPTGGVGGGNQNINNGKASYTVAFTAVQPVGQTFALANSAQQAVNTLAALAGQVRTADVAMQAQSTDLGQAEDGTSPAAITGGIQVVSPNLLNQNSTQVITVTGRGFAKVTAIPLNVKASTTSTTVQSSASTANVYRYVVTAIGTNDGAKPASSATAKDWWQGEPSQDVVINNGTNGKVTISWTNVPGATGYNVFRFDMGTVGTASALAWADGSQAVRAPSKVMTFKVAGAPADALTADNIVNAACDGTSSTSNNPLCTGYSATNDKFVKRYFVGTTTSGFVDTGVGTDYTSSIPYPAQNRPCVAYAATGTLGMCPKIEVTSVAATPLAITPTLLDTGEIVVKTKDTGVSPLQDTDLVQDVTAYLTDEVKSQFRSSGNSNTVGYLTSNQVQFRIKAAKASGSTNDFGPGKYSIKITNPDHPSLPLDVRAKYVSQVGAFQVQAQSLTSYLPSRIGRRSTNNTLVISGTGFQQNAVVQLGIFGSATSTTDRADPLKTFTSKSHILNLKTSATATSLLPLKQLGVGTDYRALDGTPDTALLDKEDTTGPFFSYDQKKVVVNSDKQITIKDITLTNASNIAGTVAAKVFNPDGSIVIGATFEIAAPGITQIVQQRDNGVWLSAPQDSTVTLQFRTELPDCDGKGTCNKDGATATGVGVAAVTYVPTPQLVLSDGSLGITCVDGVTCSSNDQSGGVFPVGDIRVLTRQKTGISGSEKWYDVAEGLFRISASAPPGLRLFTMKNGDSAVFFNYFSISAKPSVNTNFGVTYPSGAYRFFTKDGGATTAASSTTIIDDSFAYFVDTAAAIPQTRALGTFNVVGKMPRASSRRVLLTGSNFVRGSFASMTDPNNSPVQYGTSRTGKYYSDTDETQMPTVSVSPATGITISSVQVVKATDATTPVDGDKLSMGNTAAFNIGRADTANSDKSTAVADTSSSTGRVTFIITTTNDAVGGPVALTLTNPDGGTVVVPNAIVIDGAPTLDFARDTKYDATLDKTGPVLTSSATIKQGAVKDSTTVVYVYGSGFFNVASADGTSVITAPTASVSGTGVRVTKVTLGTSGTGMGADRDTVMRLELAAESTAALGKRTLTVVMPDGQPVSGDKAGTTNDVTIEVVSP